VVSNKNTDGIRYLFPSLQQNDYTNMNIPLLEIYLLDSKKQSDIENLKTNTKNQFWLFGKYQFGETLKSVEYTILLYFLEVLRCKKRPLYYQKTSGYYRISSRNTMVRW
jgi:hypothetical protein